MGLIEKSIWIRAPPDMVFSYIDDSAKRGHHMVGMGRGFHSTLLSPNDAGLGAKRRWEGTMYGVRFGWTEVVSVWSRPTEKRTSSTDGMKIDVRWKLVQKDGGTFLTITMGYDIGYSVLGRLVDWLWAERYCTDGIEEDFREMKKELESAAALSAGVGVGLPQVR